jgi:CheY-like chemotaxis protein
VLNPTPPRPSVLLVEDEPILRQVFAEALEESGFGVEEAECGDTAWGLVASGRTFDILLTDVRMPGRLDGLALARKVKASSERTSVVVMSGFVGQAAMEEGLGIFLAKPFTPSRLISALQHIVAHS